VIYTALTGNAVKVAVANPVTMNHDYQRSQPPGSARGWHLGRVLGKYVREEKALKLMEALRKMTIMPARRLEQHAATRKKKGRISVGGECRYHNL